MPSLTFNFGPYGIAEIDPSTLSAGNPVTAATIQSILAAAQGAWARNEQFFGWYSNGDTVLLPTSPIDGYVYSRSELTYAVAGFATPPPGVGFTAGQAALPTMGARGGAGQLLSLEGWFVDQTTGVVSLSTHYFATGGSETPTTDGILYVITHAQRNR